MAFDNIGALTQEQKTLLANLKSALTDASFEGGVTIAYSGGLDSRFLSFCAKAFGFNVRLLHVAGNHIAVQESQEAIDFAKDMGLTCEVVRLKLPTPQALAAAQKRRCYVCKSAIFSQLKALAAGGKLCDGTNASDTLVFRPGAQALKELGIYSPLQQAGFTKPDIRAVGKILGFANPTQAARPCLLTRFPYGVEPTADKLAVIAKAEEWIDNAPDTKGLRVRLRYPQGLPELHIEKESLTGKDETFIKDLKARLQAAFASDLSGLSIRVLDKLSGFYDQTNDAAK